MASARFARGNSNTINWFYNNLAVPTADSVDGTMFPKYITNHYVFHNGAWIARGWVRFNNGFTVMPQAAVSMDTLTTVSGPIDLRDTGLLKLNNDLYLAHNVTLTSGGYIKGNAANYGQANTIFMGGDLTLGANTYGNVLHVTGDWANNGQSGDLIIDGCGHTLTLSTNAQIFVDQNVTLTLRNMTIKTSPISGVLPTSRLTSKPPIQLASTGSKLALDNVVFDLNDDFNFKQGQLFIHNDVAITGSRAFIYSSPQPSYITSGATWSFEQGTTFSIAPATYTDQPFTAGAATSNNFIVLADQSAALSLSGCSLKTTFTGARFTKGMVLFDNKVAIDTQAGSEITGLGTGVGLKDYTVTASCVAFSPDGRYVAVGALNSNANLYIYAFNGATALGSPIASMGMGGSANAIPAMAWSPDGKFLAMGGDGAVGLRIVRFNGTATLASINTPAFGLIVNSVSWSPDGRYLAVGGNNGNTPLIVYRFNGTSLTQVTTLNPGGIQVNGVAWSPDGKYLGIVWRDSGTTYRVYAFNGTVLAGLAASGATSGSAAAFAWSPDGRYFLWSTNGLAYSLRMRRFDGSSAIYVNDTGNPASAQAFSPDGRYIISCGGTNYALWKVMPPLSVIASGSFSTVATTVAWSPDSKYVLVGGTNGTADLMVVPVIWSATVAVTQNFSNGLLFGDKAKGVNFDANVQVLSSATVKVRGKIKDDSV